MNRRIKVINLVIVISIIVMGFMVIKLFSAGFTEDEKKDMILEYLYNKYGEEFRIKSFIHSSWAYNYDQVYCYPENGTSRNSFVVWGITSDDDKSYMMHDGYYGLLIKDEYKSTMEKFTQEIFEEFILDTSFGKGVFRDELDRDTKLNGTYDNKQPLFSYTVIYIKQSSADGVNIDEALEHIANRMIENYLTGSIHIYVINNKYFDELNIGDIENKSKEQLDQMLICKDKLVAVYQNLEIHYYGEDR